MGKGLPAVLDGVKLTKVNLITAANHSTFIADLDIITLTHYYCLTAVLIRFTMNVLW